MEVAGSGLEVEGVDGEDWERWLIVFEYWRLVPYRPGYLTARRGGGETYCICKDADISLDHSSSCAKLNVAPERP